MVMNFNVGPNLPKVELNEKSNESKQMPEKVKGPSHGDELAYIFEPLGPDGKPMGDEVSSTDARVRSNFVGLISKFAHGVDEEKPDEKSRSGGNNIFQSLLPSADGKNEQYLKIGNEMTVGKDFRFCQLGLWGNMGDRLTGDVCKNLFGNLLGLLQTDKLTQGLTNQLPGAGGLGQLVPGSSNMQSQSQNQLPGLGGLGGVGGVLGNMKQPTNKNKQPQKQRPIFPGADGLFDF